MIELTIEKLLREYKDGSLVIIDLLDDQILSAKEGVSALKKLDKQYAHKIIKELT